jgi:hypothetical protein
VLDNAAEGEVYTATRKDSCGSGGERIRAAAGEKFIPPHEGIRAVAGGGYSLFDSVSFPIAYVSIIYFFLSLVFRVFKSKYSCENSKYRSSYK